MNYFSFRMISFLNVLLCFSFVNAHAHQGVELKLRSVQNEYLIREPVKLIATLINSSGQEIRIPECRLFNMNMEYLHHLEIVTPRGYKQCRRVQYISAMAIINQQYSGEPLLSGNQREFYIYPNATWQIDCLDFNVMDDLALTFNEAGDYKVKVVYVVPQEYLNLWKIDGGLKSNEIVLKFRNPKSNEDEILNSLWINISDMVRGDFAATVSFNEQKLRDVIAKHPQDPLVKYAKFSLGRKLFSIGSGIYIFNKSTENQIYFNEASSVFENILASYPDFRVDECRFFLARCYSFIDRKADAMQVFERAIHINSNLLDNYDFMRALIWNESNDVRAISSWRIDRMHGKDSYGKKYRKE